MAGRRAALVLLLLLLALQGLASGEGLGCSRTQFESGGRCCRRCPPGQKVGEPCSGEADTTCSPCEEGHFQAGQTKERHCTRSRSCDAQAGLIVHRNGSNVQDVVCRCQEGTHCSSHECETCRPHSLCGPGEGVRREGHHLNDTLCAPCAWGSFSNLSSSTAPCRPWSRCREGLFQKANGTQTTDAICELLPLKPPEAGQAHLLLVLLPVAAFLVGALLLLWHRRGRCARKRPQDPPPEPAENEEDCPAFPTQETLLGEQTGPPEKDCRLAQQEEQV